MTIFEEILGLLSGSPELHAYLLACPEQLQTTDYAHIISGAPIALTEKGRLLERLSEHMTHSEDAGLIRDYSACLKTALQALERKLRFRRSFGRTANSLTVPISPYL